MRRFALLIMLLLMALPSSLYSAGSEIWVSLDERKKIWDEIAGKGNYKISPNYIEAVFEKDGATWTIIGANAPIVTPTVYPKDWPIKGDNFAVLVIPEPITNYAILPFTEKIENAVKSDTVTITGAKDSYEPASFVIRSGDLDLRDVMIEITDPMKIGKHKRDMGKILKINKKNIDIRTVKCWYQAGGVLHDTRNKMLKPELLLHDDDLVRIDYDRQLNLVRNYETLKDAERLLPFHIPARQNKQIWLTVHITKDYPAGTYQGAVTLKSGLVTLARLALEVEVLPFTLPDPMIDYALYYEGYLAAGAPPKAEARQKTREQMLNDLIDMKEHGLTNATLWHQVDRDTSRWPENFRLLKETLQLRKEVGWGDRPLLYLDWKNIGKDDMAAYKKKVREIVAIAKAAGIKEVYIYGFDEKLGDEFAALRPHYEAVHEAGAKNFVATTEGTYVDHGREIIDIPIFWGIPGLHMKKVNQLAQAGMKIWKYSSPQAGLEEPETYRRVYGLQLLSNGFAGACNYQYQIGSWNDFIAREGRPKVMAYPTLTKPVPTIQWEGWRAGVDDVRYLTLLKNGGHAPNKWLTNECTDNPGLCRKKMIQQLLASGETRKK